MFEFSQVNIFTCNNSVTQGEKNIEEVAILYFYNILKDIVEENNCILMVPSPRTDRSGKNSVGPQIICHFINFLDLIEKEYELCLTLRLKNFEELKIHCFMILKVKCFFPQKKYFML